MPTYFVDIVCLANSRKTSGRCIAGKIVGAVPATWIRPVSTRLTGEVSEEERRFPDGSDTRILDIVRVPLAVARPHSFQTENHVIDPKIYWEKRGTATFDEAAALVEPVGSLWLNGDSSYNGTNDRVPEVAANLATHSLRLIDVPNLIVHVVVEGAEFGNGKRRVRGEFTHAGTRHVLSVTDPTIERHYLGGQNGTFAMGRVLLCVSLGDLYQGNAYKLIAGVIIP